MEKHTLVGRGLRLSLFGLQQDDLSSHRRGDCIDLLLADVACLEFNIGAAYCDHTETGLFFARFNLTPLSDENLATHDLLLYL